MSWILKILQGPNEGAETELADGQITRIGQDPSCDIVLSDCTIPPKAFELDCKGKDVSIIPLENGCSLGDRQLPPKQAEAFPAFTVLTIGTTRLCIGPAGQPWPELTWPDLEKIRLAALPPLTEAELLAITNKVRTEAEAKVAEEQSKKAAEQEKKRKARFTKLREAFPKYIHASALTLRKTAYILLGLLCLLALMAAAAGKVYRLAAPPQDQTLIVQNVHKEIFNSLVAKYALKLTQNEKQLQLSGNLEHRNDRLQVTNAAYSVYPDIKLDLSDDESLDLSIREMLFGLSDGCLVLESAKNRSAHIHGITPTEQSWHETQRILKADVPMLEHLTAKVIFADTTAARFRAALKAVGLQGLQVKWEKNLFSFQGKIPESRKNILATVLQEAGKIVPDNVAIVNSVKWLEETEEQTPRPQTPTVAPTAPPPPPHAQPAPPREPEIQLPVSGIMVTPYRCLMLKDGTRCSEGGTIRGFLVEKINIDEVTLRRGEETFLWHP